MIIEKFKLLIKAAYLMMESGKPFFSFSAEVNQEINNLNIPFPKLCKTKKICLFCDNPLEIKDLKYDPYIVILPTNS